MEDWAVWPIFVTQLVVFVLILLPRTLKIGKIRIKLVILSLLLVICFAIVISLYHDSTSVLQLYF